MLATRAAGAVASWVLVWIELGQPVEAASGSAPGQAAVPAYDGPDIESRRGTGVRPALKPDPAEEGESATGEQAQHASAPYRLQIPSIGVDAPVLPMGLESNGELEVPEGAEETGWWRGGTAPGRPGPAVLVGHRDSTVGPAVFYDLPSLQAGAIVVVSDREGHSYRYRVDRVERHPRDAFPTQRVYGDTAGPTLRLLTCGGDYDPDDGYQDNVVVFASALR